MHGAIINQQEIDKIKGQSIDDDYQETLQQDVFYLPFRPADRIVCTWTALEPINQETGQFIVLSGSHKTSQLETSFSDSRGFNTKIIYEPLRDPMKLTGTKKQLELKPGDTIFYHPVLAHGMAIGTQLNSNVKPIAISCYFAASECEYVVMSGNSLGVSTIPPSLADVTRTGVTVSNDKVHENRRVLEKPQKKVRSSFLVQSIIYMN